MILGVGIQPEILEKKNRLKNNIKTVTLQRCDSSFGLVSAEGFYKHKCTFSVSILILNFCFLSCICCD